jgi:hypothetical protein
MLALAECNDKEAIVSSISPLFDYENKSNYAAKFLIVYNLIFSKVSNGTVFDCWE